MSFGYKSSAGSTCNSSVEHSSTSISSTTLVYKMMFNKLAFATILAVATTSFAATDACCDSVQSSSSQSLSSVLGALGVILQGTNVPIGLDCSPITVSDGHRQRRELSLKIHLIFRVSVFLEPRALPTPSAAIRSSVRFSDTSALFRSMSMLTNGSQRTP